MSSTSDFPEIEGRFLILGVTSTGRNFRPSDWADRLAGVMARFQPPGAGPQTRLAYSPYVRPAIRDGVRCVIVDPQIRAVEPMAYTFLLNFARDNDLRIAPADDAGGSGAA